MERAQLTKLEDINRSNVRPLLRQAILIQNRFPELYDGYFIAGLCYYKLGEGRRAQENLKKANLICPSEQTEKLIAQSSESSKYSLGNINPGLVLCYGLMAIFDIMVILMFLT